MSLLDTAPPSEMTDQEILNISHDLWNLCRAQAAFSDKLALQMDI